MNPIEDDSDADERVDLGVLAGLLDHLKTKSHGTDECKHLLDETMAFIERRIRNAFQVEFTPEIFPHLWIRMRILARGWIQNSIDTKQPELGFRDETLTDFFAYYFDMTGAYHQLIAWATLDQPKIHVDQSKNVPPTAADRQFAEKTRKYVRKHLADAEHWYA